MIQLAKDNETYIRCCDYLQSKSTPCLKGTWLFYIESENEPVNEIKAVAGWSADFGCAIEPLQSESAVYTKSIGIFMEGFITGKGYTHITCWTSKKEWQDILIKLGYKVWSGQDSVLKQFIKEV